MNTTTKKLLIFGGIVAVIIIFIALKKKQDEEKESGEGEAKLPHIAGIMEAQLMTLPQIDIEGRGPAVYKEDEIGLTVSQQPSVTKGDNFFIGR